MAPESLRRNDPRILAWIETTLSTTARPSLINLAWHWRYEFGLAIGVTAVALASGLWLGARCLVGMAGCVLILLVAAIAWRPSRRRLIARTWCVITPHRVRTGCAQAWVQSRDGKLPTVLYTRPIDFGERIIVWCRAGTTARDLEAARDIICAACWASEMRVIANERFRHIVTLEVIRRAHTQRGGVIPVAAPIWPYLDRGDDDGSDKVRLASIHRPGFDGGWTESAAG